MAPVIKVALKCDGVIPGSGGMPCTNMVTVEMAPNDKAYIDVARVNANRNLGWDYVEGIGDLCWNCRIESETQPENALANADSKIS